MNLDSIVARWAKISLARLKAILSPVHPVLGKLSEIDKKILQVLLKPNGRIKENRVILAVC
jgi:hypothetical protein